MARFVAEKVRGRSQLDLAGSRTTFLLHDGVLTNKGSGDSKVELPLPDIQRLRIGTLQVNPSGTVTMGGLHRTEAQIHLVGIKRPLVIETAPDNQAFMEFFRELADSLLQANGVVERGRGYGVPLVWAAVLIVAMGWQTRSLIEASQSGTSLLTPLLVTVTLVIVLGGVFAWTWRIYAPRRVTTLAELDALQPSRSSTGIESAGNP